MRPAIDAVILSPSQAENNTIFAILDRSRKGKTIIRVTTLIPPLYFCQQKSGYVWRGRNWATYLVKYLNNFVAPKTAIDEIMTIPFTVENTMIVKEVVLEGWTISGILRCTITKVWTDIFGHPTDFPPDNPNWSLLQSHVCRPYPMSIWYPCTDISNPCDAYPIGTRCQLKQVLKPNESTHARMVILVWRRPMRKNHISLILQ